MIRLIEQIILFLLLCCNVYLTNPRSSTLWKLNVENNKIIEGNPFVGSYSINNHRLEDFSDSVFNIITSTILSTKEGSLWTKQSVENYCIDCYYHRLNDTVTLKNSLLNKDPEDSFSCGKPVNFTYYDHLVGISNRNNHPHAPEPQAAYLFAKQRNILRNDLDLDALEKRLKKSFKEKPKTVHLFNQIGNFWRIKGDTQRSIECFRRALSLAPHSADVLLNLARVLFNLQYLDDAIFLTRRSLEVLPPDKDTWQQHFTLGEIFKAYGHYQEAAVHLKHTLDLKPDFEPALMALKDMEVVPKDKVHVYTLIIIIFLVIGVLLAILGNADSSSDLENSQGNKMQRHFNKAMAMKTLRGFSSKNAASRPRNKI